MHYQVKKKYIAYCLLLIALKASCQESKEVSLSEELSKIAELGYLPGFAVAIVNKNNVLYQNAFGYANLEYKKPFTVNTIQSVASVSKTTIGFSLLKLVEKGKINLDTPINDILPFKVCNPNFETDTIRIIHLATHTSGILDTETSYDSRNRFFIPRTLIDKGKVPEEWLSYFEGYRANKALSLGEFCQNALSKEGEWYAKDIFSTNRAGTHYAYSNLAATLAAHIVEIISGKSFSEFTEENLFHPLGMTDTSWRIQEVEQRKLSTSYLTEEKIATPIFGNNTFPDGGLHTSCNDLSQYLLEMIKGYHGQSDLMHSESFKELFKAQLPEGLTRQSNQRKIVNSGVFWMHAANNQLFHNGGNTLGGTIYMWFNTETGVGRILMTNYLVEDKNSHQQFMSIWKALDNYIQEF